MAGRAEGVAADVTYFRAGMAVWQYILLFATALMGGWVAQVGGERYGRALPLLLSFGGAYLLGVAALELLPEVFSGTASRQDAGLWLLLGFVVQLMLEGLSQGVEHGHVHAHRGAGYGYAIGIMAGLGLHAFFEGLPLGAGYGAAHTDHLLVGIVLHKLPAAFALGLLLRRSDYSRGFIWGCLVLFALLSPLGALLGEAVSIIPHWRTRILAAVVGSLLHISTTILFEADGGRSHGLSPLKYAVVLIGLAVAYFSAH